MRYIISCFFLILSFGCGEKKVILNEKTLSYNPVLDTVPKILTYGLPTDHRARNILAKKYGFKFIHVAGCVVAKELWDSIQIENKKADKILEKRFGKDWRENFWLRVDSMEQIRKED